MDFRLRVLKYLKNKRPLVDPFKEIRKGTNKLHLSFRCQFKDNANVNIRELFLFSERSNPPEAIEKQNVETNFYLNKKI